jgi:rubrerythrin
MVRDAWAFMRFSTTEPQADGEEAEDLGGDPACWVNRVCPECGLLVEQRNLAACPRCDTQLPV